MRRYGLFLLGLFLGATPYLHAQVAPAEVRECQEALLKRKVRNGEFTGKVLSEALRLPVDLRADVDPQAVEQLLGKLGADSFDERSAATEKLMQDHFAPSKLSALLESTDNPEIRMRAQQVLDHWLKPDPKSQAEKKFLMWINLPTCLTKLETYATIYTSVCEHQLDHQRCYDVAAGLQLDDFPAAERPLVIATCLQRTEVQGQIPASHFVEQLSGDDWTDRRMLDPLRDRLGDNEAHFDSSLFEALLFGIPDRADPEGWRKILGSAETRKGAVAALLVKLGDKEALPDFLKLLNEEWREVNISNGRIGGGGHSLFYSPFTDYKLLRLPAYRKFSVQIIEGIRGKFDDERIAIHLAYLNAVRPFADTEAGLQLLTALSVHRCPQTALAASLMLFGQEQEAALKPFMDALRRASGSDIANNWLEMVRVLRMLRAKIAMDPANAGQHKACLEEAMKPLLAQLPGEGMEYQRDGILDFLYAELLPFGLCRVERGPLIEMLSRCSNFARWNYPATAVKLIVEDALQKGDLEKLLAELRTRAAAPDATPGDEVLFASCILRSGALNLLSAPLTEKLWKHLSDPTCPPQIAKTAWIVSPQTAFERLHPDVFADVVSSLLLNPKGVDLIQVARKLEAGKDPWRGRLVRLSYGLEGGRLADFDITQGDFTQPVESFCGMDWAAKPGQVEATRKFAEIRSILGGESKHESKANSLIEGAPNLLHSLGVALSEEKDTDLLALQIMAEMAFRRGDRAAYDRLLRKAKDTASSGASYYRRSCLEKQAAILDAAQGKIEKTLTRMRSQATGSDNCLLTSLLYEKGFAEEARRYRTGIPDTWRSHEWERSECSLVWAWNEALSGNIEEAIRLAETGMVDAHSKAISDYALMLRRLLKEHPGGLKEFMEILRTQRVFEKRAAAARAMAQLAGRVTDPDLKSLAAFLSARVLRASGAKKEDAEPLWRMGAEAGGLHARYCKCALDALPGEAQAFYITPNWYRRTPIGPTFTPFTEHLGLRYRAQAPYVLMLRAEWLDPYGIPANVDTRTPFHNGGGWWLYIKDQEKAWVPGEWSVIVEHSGGAEYHQSTLLPFGYQP
jgi:hypothetical protein